MDADDLLGSTTFSTGLPTTTKSGGASCRKRKMTTTTKTGKTRLGATRGRGGVSDDDTGDNEDGEATDVDDYDAASAARGSRKRPNEDVADDESGDDCSETESAGQTLRDPPLMFSSKSLREARAAQGPKISEAEKMREYLTTNLGFDPNVAKNSWKSEPIAVPGTYNRFLPESANGHGPGCPLCIYLASAGTDPTMFNHMNVINTVVNLAGNNAANVVATASMVETYWNVNVATPENEDIPKVTQETVLQHLQSTVIDGKSDAAKTIRNINAVEDYCMAHMKSVNTVTGETRLNRDSVQTMRWIPHAKRVIHEANWIKSNFVLPGVVDPASVAAVAPIIRIFK